MRVIMIAATTLCGRINPAPLGSVRDRRFLEKMRDSTDASLMGSGTLRRENPEMRGTAGLSKHRLRVFITQSGDIPVDGATAPAGLEVLHVDAVGEHPQQRCVALRFVSQA